MRTAAALGGEDFGDVLGEQSRSADRLNFSRKCEKYGRVPVLGKLIRRGRSTDV